jgi:L-ascorbate metabolism protein UlaG (beta-lactamase superfamily)
MNITWIGTATALLEHNGFTVLTDPSFLHQGQRAYLGKGLWSRRLTEPSCQVGDLPPIDAIVLSHLHGDHWDKPAANQLDRELPVLTTLQSQRKLLRQGFGKAVGLSTWDSHVLRKDERELRITAAPGRHGRGPMQRALPDVMGSVLTFPDGATVYVTGDTLVIDELKSLRDRFPELDVGLWHLGGTRILGMLATMDAVQGADLLELVRPRTCLPIHHGDYPVFKDPVERFHEEVARRGLPGVRSIARGETAQLQSMGPRPPREPHGT